MPRRGVRNHNQSERGPSGPSDDESYYLTSNRGMYKVIEQRCQQ